MIPTIGFVSRRKIIMQICLTLGVSLCSVVLMRNSTLYALPDTFGVFTRILFTYARYIFRHFFV